MPRRPFFAVAADRTAKKPAWLNDPTKYHDRGDIDFSSCSQTCYEQGDFFGLDDLFTEQPAVMSGLAQIYASWVTKYNVDGFRVDTAKHVNSAFFGLWVPRIQAAARSAGVPDFQVFGEVTLNDDIELSAFVRDRGLPNVLDFPFQDAAAGFAAGTTGAKALASRLADDDYFRGPSGTAPTPPTFLGNHDMGRAALQILQHGAASDSKLLARVVLGYDLLYLLRGAPVVYYGDEVGMIGRGGDKAARQDMFPTQVAEWKTQERVGSPPIGSGSSFDVTNPIEGELRSLGALRDSHPALSTGATIAAPRGEPRARRQPDRPGRAARVRGRAQLGDRRRQGHDRDGDTVRDLVGAARRRRSAQERRERPARVHRAAAVGGRAPRRQRPAEASRAEACAPLRNRSAQRDPEGRLREGHLGGPAQRDLRRSPRLGRLAAPRDGRLAAVSGLRRAGPLPQGREDRFGRRRHGDRRLGGSLASAARYAAPLARAGGQGLPGDGERPRGRDLGRDGARQRAAAAASEEPGRPGPVERNRGRLPGEIRDQPGVA